MFITARGRTGDPLGRGVVGHARSDDLASWRLMPPLSAPSPDGFGHLEVMQVEIIDGTPVLIFSCPPDQTTAARQAQTHHTGIWAAPVASVTGPFDLADAYPIIDSNHYVGRLLRRRDGRWAAFAFRHNDPTGQFLGGISDPMPVTWTNGRLSTRLRAGTAH
jgi:beta-fructofuranosidase